ncbi:MAG: 2Fe-2S iron-sulfur cluster binding domain-containing protein, partial [Acidimicrobiia bacterium]|nr:2Fe-2S iron-sulfur cluster binding domain-containing protein [Acidimicrobiia bacterium]
MEVEIKVNGEDWALSVAPADVLLDVLREQVGTKSPKIGCERGDCGSCTI